MDELFPAGSFAKSANEQEMKFFYPLISAPRASFRPWTHTRHNREVLQIGNLEAGVNVDIEYHPAGSFKPQNVYPKARSVFNSLFVMFAFFFACTLFQKKN